MKKYHFLFPVLALIFGVAGLWFVISHVDNRINREKIPPYYDASAFSTSITPVISSKQAISFDIPILFYHYVEYVKDKRDTIRQQLDISPGIFENQVKTLKNATYSALFIDDVVDILEGKKVKPVKSVVLTFDDGYGDFYTDVFPILKKYQMRATAYIVPGFLDKPNYMTSQQVREIAASGLVEVASHTVHHINLKNATDAVAIKEIRDSKSQLEKLIGKEVRNFAYPYGGFTQHTAQLVEELGYRTAASVVSGAYQSVGNRYYLSRLRPGARTGNVLLTWLEHIKK